jgi:hypothetical protein
MGQDKTSFRTEPKRIHRFLWGTNTSRFGGFAIEDSEKTKVDDA